MPPLAIPLAVGKRTEELIFRKRNTIAMETPNPSKKCYQMVTFSKRGNTKRYKTIHR